MTLLNDLQDIKPVIISGGTAVGKSTLSMQISQRFGYAVVSSDSFRRDLRNVHSSDEDCRIMLDSSYLLRGAIRNKLESDCIFSLFNQQCSLVCGRMFKRIYRRETIFEGIHLLPEHLPWVLLKSAVVLVLERPRAAQHISWIRDRCERLGRPSSPYLENYHSIERLSRHIALAWKQTPAAQVHFIESPYISADLVWAATESAVR